MRQVETEKHRVAFIQPRISQSELRKDERSRIKDFFASTISISLYSHKNQCDIL